MSNKRIIVKSFKVDEKQTVLPVFIDLPSNIKTIDGILITTSDDNSTTDSILKGRIKILTNIYKRSDLPDFDVFAHKEKKWNKNLIEITTDIKNINKQLKIAYQPILSLRKDAIYDVTVYLKCTISNDC